MDINKVIDIVRFFKEEGEGGAPTNVSGSASLGFDPNTETPPVNIGSKKKNRRPYAKGGRGSRKWWLQYLKGR